MDELFFSFFFFSVSLFPLNGRDAMRDIKIGDKVTQMLFRVLLRKLLETEVGPLSKGILLVSVNRFG